MPEPSHGKATAGHKADNEADDAEPTTTDPKKSNWKPLMVVTLKATEKVLDGLPIPAAKGCISIVLKVIEASDVSTLRSRAF